MQNLVTVIIQTSPLPSHPSSALLEALFRSFDRVVGLKQAGIIILADGCDCEERNENEDVIDTTYRGGTTTNKANFKHGTVPFEARVKYKQHLKLLKEKIDNKQAPFKPAKNGNIQLLQLPYRYGSARAIAAAFEILSISTPYVLIGQHDNFFVRDVSYLPNLLQYMELDPTKSWLQCIHFPSTSTLNYVQKVKRRYDLDISNFCVDFEGGSFIPLVFWYGRTHLARTSYYTSFVLKLFPNIQVSDHFEELIGTQQLNEVNKIKRGNSHDRFEEEFRRVHAKYGNYVFLDDSKDPQSQAEVLYHLSGRKVRAATNTTCSMSEDIPQKPASTRKTPICFNPHSNSFTTARRSIASVQGLEFVTSQKKNESKTPSQFKQNCFHCGKKGHSFKFCPFIQEEDGIPCIDVVHI